MDVRTEFPLGCLGEPWRFRRGQTGICRTATGGADAELRPRFAAMVFSENR